MSGGGGSFIPPPKLNLKAAPVYRLCISFSSNMKKMFNLAKYE